jgi:hypothetical protein
MKLLLSLLVVANLVLFGWLHGWMVPWGGDGRDPGRLALQYEPQRLRVTTQRADRAGAGLLAAQPAVSPALVASVTASLRGAACVMIGPMSESDAVRVQVALDALVSDLRIDTERAADTASWWVYVPPAAGDILTRLADLRQRGVVDTYVIPDGAWRGAISLGLFKQEDLAVALQRKLFERGVRTARVAPRGPTPGRLTLTVRPMTREMPMELARLRALMPDAVARSCPRFSGR